MPVKNNEKGIKERTNITIKFKMLYTTKKTYTILNSMEVYEEPVSWTKEFPHCEVKFMADEENKIVSKVCPAQLKLSVQFDFIRNDINQ